MSTTIIHSIYPDEQTPTVKCLARLVDGKDSFMFEVRTGKGLDVSMFFKSEAQFLEFCQQNNLTFTDMRPTVSETDSAA